ncbi:protein of unknown function [Burkholderia multivorans]
MARTVHVIGAGLAGLAAAVALQRRGRRPVLHDAQAQAGARYRSWFDDTQCGPLARHAARYARAVFAALPSQEMTRPAAHARWTNFCACGRLDGHRPARDDRGRDPFRPDGCRRAPNTIREMDR